MKLPTDTTGDDMTGCHHYIPATVNKHEENVTGDEIRRISQVARRKTVKGNRKKERECEIVEEEEIKSELESERKKGR